MSGVARVVARLEDAILNGAYAAGDALPPERELATQLGVSRSVLREALGQLANMGLVTRVQGSGTRVAQRSGDAVLAGYGRLLRTGAHSLDDLMVVRIPLETTMARLAAEHRGDAHVERLATLQKRFIDPERSFDEAIQADIEFHVELARASGNRIFEFVLRPIETLLMESRRQTLTRDGVMVAWREHEAIFDAVKRGDGDAAEAAMRYHLMRIKFADLAPEAALAAMAGLRPASLPANSPSRESVMSADSAAAFDKPASNEHPIHELIRKRWSPRSFADRDVEPEKILSLLEAARWAASSMNEQPWAIVAATRDEADAHARLLACMAESNQAWTKNAPLLMLFAAKLTLERTGAPNRHAFHDVGLAIGNLALQATALDLSLHMIAGFSPEKARQTLSIPANYEPHVMLAIGYRGSPDLLPDHLKQRELAPRVRKPLSDFVFAGKWGEASPLVAKRGTGS